MPTKSIAAQAPPLGDGFAICATASSGALRIHRGERARALGGLALDRIDIDGDGAVASPIALMIAMQMRPRPPAPITTTGSLFTRDPSFFSAP